MTDGATGAVVLAEGNLVEARGGMLLGRIVEMERQDG